MSKKWREVLCCMTSLCQRTQVVELRYIVWFWILAPLIFIFRRSVYGDRDVFTSVKALLRRFQQAPPAATRSQWSVRSSIVPTVSEQNFCLCIKGNYLLICPLIGESVIWESPHLKHEWNDLSLTILTAHASSGKSSLLLLPGLQKMSDIPRAAGTLLVCRLAVSSR